ncbi:MAG: adenylate/guanylate cyclase domain-containing protein [Deltaproteobacteria bacterium]|nr:adenylate/guanylate cyclase domain-containing protein [Deltaproteobacteria bacterium]
MKIGIKIKLALILSVLLFITTFSIGFILIAHQRSSLEAQMRSMAGTITHEFASNSKIPFMQKDSLATNLLIQNILKYPGISEAYILNDNFLIEAHDDASKAGTEFGGRTLIQAASASSGEPPWLVRDSDGVITFASPIVFQGTTVGYTVISFSNKFIQERVRIAVTRVTVIGIIAVVVVSLLSIPLSSTLLRPIFRLFKGTKEIALGNFDYRIPEISKDEIGDLVSSFNRMASELKKKEILKGVFNRYVSSHVADEIFKDPESIRLGGERRDVTVLFADIRGFTAISRSMEPEAIVEILNRYFTLVTEIIFRFEGTIDKFIGDAVMSVFGSPIKTSIHLEQGIKSAVAVKLAIEDINQVRRMQGLIPLQMGIGINSGEVIVGNMGSQVRMEYTAVGDAVNIASRLTDLAKAGDILVSEAVYKSLKDNIIAEERPGVSIKGIDKPVTVYNVLGLKGGWDEEVEDIVYRVVTELEREGVVL